MKTIIKYLFASISLVVASNTFAEAKMCTMDYSPVCAKVQVQCIKAPCDPVYETFGNKCMMESNSLATYAYDWECKSDSVSQDNSWTVVNMPNPASVKCENDGWTLNLDSWNCTFKNWKVCNEWSYFRWECSNKADSKYVLEDVVYKKETNLAKINVVYPKISISSINAVVSDYIKNYLSNFSKNIWTEVLSNNWKNELDTSYEINSVSNILTIKFVIYEFTGWAHGSTVIKTFNFDTKSWKEIVIKNQALINKVSNYSVNYFNNLSDNKTINSDKDRIKEWLQPTFNNFSNWLLTWFYKENGKTYLRLNFIFPQYQIAPYSDWVQNINIDTKDLK